MHMIAKTESVWSLLIRAGSLSYKYSSRGLLEAVYQIYSESSHIHRASTRLSQRCTYSLLDWLGLNYLVFHGLLKFLSSSIVVISPPLLAVVVCSVHKIPPTSFFECSSVLM